jgi:hypothetical protein
MTRRSKTLFGNIVMALILVLSAPLLFDSPSLISYAEEFFEDDFDDVEPVDIPELDIDKLGKEEAQVESNFFMGGFIKQIVEYGFDRKDRKLSKVQSILNLESSYKITDIIKFKISANGFYDAAYAIEGREEYSNDTLDENESKISLRELFVNWKINEHLFLKAGRQIIAWGESDYSRVTDVINPRDMKGPGLTNLEDARLPVASVRLSFEWDNFTTDLVSIHEHPGSSIGGYGSDFDYYSSLRVSVISVDDEDTPGNTFENTGFAMRVAKLFNGGDIAFYTSKTYDDLPVLRSTNIEFSGFSLSMLSLSPEYHKVKTYGVSGNMAKGSVLYKFDMAFTEGRMIMRSDFLNNITYGMNASELETFKPKDQITSLLGIEYTGISDLRITIEVENIHTLDFDSSLATDENDKRVYLQSTYNLLNETLELDLLCVYFERGKGGFARLSTNYDIIDNLNFEVGVILYGADNEDSLLYYFKDQDRFFSRIKYSF